MASTAAAASYRKQLRFAKLGEKDFQDFRKNFSKIANKGQKSLLLNIEKISWKNDIFAFC
jgi:hypothetical protein